MRWAAEAAPAPTTHDANTHDARETGETSICLCVRPQQSAKGIKSCWDAIDGGLSEEAFDLRVAEIKAQREREIGTGLLESSPGATQGKKRRKRARPFPFLQEQASIQESFVKGEHVRMVVDALSHEAMP